MTTRNETPRTTPMRLILDYESESAHQGLSCDMADFLLYVEVVAPDLLGPCALNFRPSRKWRASL
jgi:hypothetical protein